MKKLIIIFMIVLVSSCLKQSDENVDLQKINEVISFRGTKSQQVVSFSILTPSEKVYAWKAHLLEAKTKFSFSKNQLAIIDEALNLLTVDIYNAAIKDKYKGQFAKLTYNGVKEFGAKQYLSIFESLHANDPITNSGLDVYSLGGSCDCRFDLGCVNGPGGDKESCKSGNCQTTDGGCGPFGWMDCKGNCTIGGVEQLD
jgi:hypothetical protein